MTLKDLIGFRLVDFDLEKEEIIIAKDEKRYKINVRRDEGDCCGYTELTGELYISQDDIRENPIITNVESVKQDENYTAVTTITFFGSCRPLATLTGLASSESGYGYGACVTLECEDLQLEEVVAEY